MTVALRRTMGVRDVALFSIVAVVSLRWIATAAAAGPGALMVWLIACLTLFVPLALTVVEVSSRYPGEGGLYLWTGRAFGGFAGFMSAWMYWVSTLIYLPGLLYFAAGNLLFAGGDSWRALSDQPAYYMLVSLVGIGTGVALNLRGLEMGKWFHNLGALCTWVPALALIAMGAMAWTRFGSATPLSADPAVHGGLRDLYFWSTVAFAFGGIEGAALMGDEIRDPRRTMPRALLLAGVVITGIYFLGTAAVLVAVPAGEASGLQGVMQAIERMGDRVGVPGLTRWMAAMVGAGALAGASAWVAATARLPFVAGVDRYLPRAFGRLHPRWGTPVVALLVQGIGAAAIALMGQAGATVRGAYDVLVSMGVITYFVPFLLLFLAMIRLQREPLPAGAWGVPGGRAGAMLLALLGLATTAIAMVLAVFPPGEPGERWSAAVKIVAGSAFLTLLGAAFYWRGKGRGA